MKHNNDKSKQTKPLFPFVGREGMYGESLKLLGGLNLQQKDEGREAGLGPLVHIWIFNNIQVYFTL